MYQNIAKILTHPYNFLNVNISEHIWYVNIFLKVISNIVNTDIVKIQTK